MKSLKELKIKLACLILDSLVKSIDHLDSRRNAPFPEKVPDTTTFASLLF